MESKAKFLGHPAHQMLIVFPLGLLATAVIFDVIALATQEGKWSQIAYWMTAAGIAGGLIAAIFGVLDYLRIPSGTRAKSIGFYHGCGNAVVLLLFAVSWVLREDAAVLPRAIPLILSFAGAGLAMVTGWLGGELVDRLGVGVDEGANLDAPSSLSGPAGASARRA